MRPAISCGGGLFGGNSASSGLGMSPTGSVTLSADTASVNLIMHDSYVNPPMGTCIPSP